MSAKDSVATFVALFYALFMVAIIALAGVALRERGDLQYRLDGEQTRDLSVEQGYSSLELQQETLADEIRQLRAESVRERRELAAVRYSLNHVTVRIHDNVCQGQCPR